MAYNINLEEIGRGSYGAIYKVPGHNDIVIKIHPIENATINTHDRHIRYCDTNWKHEYQMQLAIFNCAESRIKRNFAHIVKPIEFTYATRRHNNRNVPLDCRIKMEKMLSSIDPRTGPGEIYDFYGKLRTFVKEEYISRIARRTVPFLYLGDTKERIGHITLPMLIGSEEIKLTDAVSYYNINDGVGLNIIKGMFNTFFQIIACGYMPRDIEYVYNCKEYSGRSKTYFSVLDFNQVETLEQREGRSRIQPYDLSIDTSHIYIDLCGLRDIRTRNPYIVEESTPQWSFLCNPLITPELFLLISRKIPNIGFIKEIREYINTYIFTPAFSKITNPELRGLINSWNNGLKFYKSQDNQVEYVNFDILLQKYFLSKLVYSLKSELQEHGSEFGKVLAIFKIPDTNFDNIVASIKELNVFRLQIDENDETNPYSLFGGYKHKKIRKSRRNIHGKKCKLKITRKIRK